MRIVTRFWAFLVRLWESVFPLPEKPVKPSCTVEAMSPMAGKIRTTLSLSPAASDVEARNVTVSVNGTDDPTLAQQLAGTASTFDVVTAHGSAVVVSVIDVNEDGVQSDPAQVSFSALDTVKPPVPTVTVTGSAVE